MTINTLSITDGPYAGNGVAASFAYNFRIDEDTEIAVYETDPFGNVTLLTLTTDYTVSGVGNPVGGSVTRVAGALPTGYTWYVRSAYIPTQLTAFASQGGFFPDVHEYAFDKLSYIAQQLQDQLNRSLRLDISDPSIESGSMVLPAASQRASKYVGFDLNGDVITLEGSGTTTDSALVAFNPGVGGVTRSVQDELRDTINVRQYGAVLDGVTDDTAAFQTAWAQCVLQRKWLYAEGDIALISSSLILTDSGSTWWNGTTEQRPIGFDFRCVLKYTGTGPCVRTQGGIMGVTGYIKGLVGPGVTIGTSHVLDGAMTAASTTLTSASNPFGAATIGNAGDTVEVYGAGPEGTVLVTTIATVVGAGDVTLTDAAATTVTNALVRIIPATYPTYGVIVGRSSTVFNSTNGTDGVKIEVGSITDFDCNFVLNGWNNDVTVGTSIATHTAMVCRSSNANRVSLGNTGGMYLGGGLLAARRARTAVNGVRIYSGAGSSYDLGAVQYCGLTDAGLGMYCAADNNNITAYFEGNYAYGSHYLITGDGNTLRTHTGGTPLGTQIACGRVQGFGNQLLGLKPRESASDITENSPSSNIDGLLVYAGNSVDGAYTQHINQDKSALSDDLLVSRVVAGWVPFGTLAETASTGTPNGYPLSMTGSFKCIKLETEAIGVGNATNAYQYTLNTAVSTTGQTSTRGKLTVLARTVANSLGALENPNIMVSVINGACANNVIADGTAGKEMYAHYATRLSPEWQLITIDTNIHPLPATLKFRISVREQNRAAGTAALEVYFPEPFFSFNADYEDGHLFRAPVHRITTVDANASATLASDGARVIKLTGTPSVTVVTAITAKWNSYVTVVNATGSAFTILGVAVAAGTTATWFKDDAGTFYPV